MPHQTYPVSEKTAKNALINQDKYQSLYKESIENNEEFWKQQAQRLDWMKPFTKVKDTFWSDSKVSIKWFEDGILNISQNCIDRHLLWLDQFFYILNH